MDEWRFQVRAVRTGEIDLKEGEEMLEKKNPMKFRSVAATLDSQYEHRQIRPALHTGRVVYLDCEASVRRLTGGDKAGTYLRPRMQLEGFCEVKRMLFIDSVTFRRWSTIVKRTASASPGKSQASTWPARARIIHWMSPRITL